MDLQVLYLLVAVLLFGFTSCSNNNPKVDAAIPSWRFPVSRGIPKERIGRQMPPHPEPDAVLINVDGNGQPRIPGGFPGNPGIFGAPRDPGVFGFPSSGGGPGVNAGPDVFGTPQGPGVFGIPQGPDMSGIPQGPGVFGIPQGPDVSGIPQGPGVFGIPHGPDAPGMPQGPGVFGIPQGPSVFGLPEFPDTFSTPGFHIIPRNPAEPNVYGPSGLSSGRGMIVTRSTPTVRDTRVDQNRPVFTLRSGIFVAPGNPLQPSELEMFGQRGVFAMVGNGNVPGAPTFFYPGRSYRTPRFPETFVPTPEGIFPGVFYPETRAVPNPPRGNSDGNFPTWEGAGGREINDEPAADLFPLIDTRPTTFQSS